MAGQSEPQMSPEELRADLLASKERLRAQAGELTVKQCMVNHPYISLGAAFFSGVMAGESHEIRMEIAQKLIHMIGNELVAKPAKDR